MSSASSLGRRAQTDWPTDTQEGEKRVYRQVGLTLGMTADKQGQEKKKKRSSSTKGKNTKWRFPKVAVKEERGAGGPPRWARSPQGESAQASLTGTEKNFFPLSRSDVKMRSQRLASVQLPDTFHARISRCLVSASSRDSSFHSLLPVTCPTNLRSSLPSGRLAEGPTTLSVGPGCVYQLYCNHPHTPTPPNFHSCDKTKKSPEWISCGHTLILLN